jgi:hypothetical protein
LTLEPNRVLKGPVEFDIKNDGQREHSLIIIRTSLPADELPTEDDGSVDQGGADVDVEHEVDAIDDGDETGRTYELDPGTYVLISNEVHEENGERIADYAEGMYNVRIADGDGGRGVGVGDGFTLTRAAD